MASRCLWYRYLHGQTGKLNTNRLSLNAIQTKSTSAASVHKGEENLITTNAQNEPESRTSVTDDGHPEIDLSFNNPREAYRSKTTAELLRAYFVFQLCSVKFIVDNNKKLMKWGQSIIGTNLFHKLMKATFYGQFAAGEDRVAIYPLLNRNIQFGVKSILEYSAEDDVPYEKAMVSYVPEKMKDISAEPNRQRVHAHKGFGDRRDQVISSGTCVYEREDQCDKNLKIFLSSIDAVADVTNKTGICAIKMTALGRPQLLLQMSDVLVSARNLFEKLALEEGDNFSRGFREDEFLFKLHEMGMKITPEECSRWFSILDLSQDGLVDIMDWDNLLDVNMKLNQLFVIPDPKTGDLKPILPCLSEDMEREMRNMLHRINEITKYAMERDVRVMVDAEQTYFQPAINRLTMEMMKKFNKEKAIIFNTYQCYLKAAHKRLRLDLGTAFRHNIYFGAKLVRGAYMEQERERAVTMGYEDPINPSFDATTSMYNKLLREVMRQIQLQERGKIAVMVASHNEDTVRYTVKKMKEFGVKPADNVICFGQLLGMSDQVSFPLGQAGYSVYKYVPYGPVDVVLPYLSRRAMENRGILQKVKKEKTLLSREILRRFKNGQFMYDPQKNIPNIKPV